MALLAMITCSGVDPKRVEFEITETALLRFRHRRPGDHNAAAGISIALGAGYSSPSHIHRLGFDKLKIDKSFVMNFDRDARCMNITRSVANLCQNLGIASVAEGVESEEIAEGLKAMGVRLAQGYHFSRPLPLELAIDYAARCEAAASPRNSLSAGANLPTGLKSTGAKLRRRLFMVVTIEVNHAGRRSHH
ncbi:EAL domain-containing protein [Rhizobium leguminosarum]|uniref:EAL domain-containing protein n=1 Tax=Rhizobium leguminosarum TaxID=384 RepID=UPI001C969101|nr:EAL domain-containing protein [Rhizobium leguminosarum]MBY5569116.1 EAL domain-containing protein [Rhizobium leguminosarum]MBY5576354.1 EAL domain-containing protein [Rhizobium leguminosarum]